MGAAHLTLAGFGGEDARKWILHAVALAFGSVIVAATVAALVAPRLSEFIRGPDAMLLTLMGARSRCSSS